MFNQYLFIRSGANKWHRYSDNLSHYFTGCQKCEIWRRFFDHGDLWDVLISNRGNISVTNKERRLGTPMTVLSNTHLWEVWAHWVPSIKTGGKLVESSKHVMQQFHALTDCVETWCAGTSFPHTYTQHLYVCSTNAITVVISILTLWHFCCQMYQKVPKITDRTKFPPKLKITPKQWQFP